MALDRALELVGDGEDSEAARDLMVRVFEVLGADHTLTREYRPRLARALF
jgi:thioredoxin-like negative regulator of GroEL